MKIPLLLILICISVNASSQENINVELISSVEIGERGNDIWGYVDNNGLEYAIMGSRNKTSIFSLEDINNPLERASIQGAASIWRDIKHYDNFIYVTCDTGEDGLLIIDMSNAPDVIEHKFWKPMLDVGNGDEPLNKCHNLYIDDLIYSSEIQDGHFSVYNVSDKTNPVRTIMQSTTTFTSHSAWPSDDGNFLFTCDERANAFLEAYDLSDPTNVNLIDKFKPLETVDSGLIPHNPHYLNGFLYISWNTDGLEL